MQVLPGELLVLPDVRADRAADAAGAEQQAQPLPVDAAVVRHSLQVRGALVEDRSGLALRGITTLAGVIDSGYRGELKIVLTNLSPEPQTIAPGHRIAQLRVVERIQAVFAETDELAETPRAGRGFGSTGV